MELFAGLNAQVSALAGCTLTLGTFDGVHLGHRALLAHAVADARAAGTRAVLVTLEPHPREVLEPGQAPARLTSLREKWAALEDTGLDAVWLLHFNAGLAALAPAAFARRVLHRGLRARRAWIGADFRFGKARLGDAGDLERLGRSWDCDVRVMADHRVNGERVSSTRIRGCLAAGDLGGAARLLGRPYTMMGRVVPGRGLGRDLGFATANIPLRRRRVPLTGIYAARTRFPGGARDAVVSLGTRPTVGGDHPVLEAHLFDFEGNLYGRLLEVEFVRKLRDEATFSGLEALTRQMEHDALAAKAYLGQSPA